MVVTLFCFVFGVCNEHVASPGRHAERPKSHGSEQPSPLHTTLHRWTNELRGVVVAQDRETSSLLPSGKALGGDCHLYIGLSPFGFGAALRLSSRTARWLGRVRPLLHVGSGVWSQQPFGAARLRQIVPERSSIAAVQATAARVGWVGAVVPMHGLHYRCYVRATATASSVGLTVSGAALP